MYSDIIPPKKNNNLSKIKSITKNETVRILKNEPILTSREIYHTIDGKDKKSNWPTILVLISLCVLVIVYYSVFNNKTRIFFESKSTIFEIKDNISMNLSEKNTNSSSTLSYNLIYNNNSSDIDRNIFAPAVVENDQSTSSATSTIVTTSNESDIYNLNTATTTPFNTKKVRIINETNANVPLRKDTRFDVNGVTYYLDKEVRINPANRENLSATNTDQVKYKIIGFKGTSDYDKVYAVEIETSNTLTQNIENESSVKTVNAPNQEILSLIPDNFISLKKNYIYDKNTNQSALVVVDKKDFEKVLFTNSKILQDYINSLKPISDIVEYEIQINDYDLTLDANTGLPLSFKNLIIEIKPIIIKDKVAKTFAGFSKDTMKKIKNEISKHVEMQLSYSPFWVNKVSDEDHITVEVK